ncbi:MAG TPA: ATPase [Anaerolineae bacterium]|nr:ATPase [Anaerolineae bacterium]HIQ05145.1 ATPase [Anaerolineae bacterium]
MARRDLVLGIDGGGTKTVCVALDVKGHERGRGMAGSSNYHNVGLVAAQAALKAAIEQALRAAGADKRDVRAICLGMSGVARPRDRKRVSQVLEAIGPFPKTLIFNDAIVALTGGVGRCEGVVVISGTGCIAYGVNRQGEKARASGWGPLLGDEGSGYAIGMAALRAATCAYDGSGPPTILVERVLQFLGLGEMEDLVDWAYGQPFRWQRFARLAVVVEQAALEGDVVARGILRRAGEALGRAANAVIRRLGMANEPFELVTVGGVFKTQLGLREALAETVHTVAPQAQLIFPRRGPAEGAALLALEAVLGAKSCSATPLALRG